MSTTPSLRERSGPGSRTALGAAVLVMVAAMGLLAWGPLSSADSTGTSPSEELAQSAGHLPEGTTLSDDVLPGVSRLQPSLLAALRAAASDAAVDGVTFTISSGWRTAAYQQRLLDEAVATYGSASEAARWVSTPERSAHVSGEAVDVGTQAASWLSQHGAAYGLCQIYGNEPWHFELRPAAVDDGCPDMFRDPTEDPRMQP